MLAHCFVYFYFFISDAGSESILGFWLLHVYANGDFAVRIRD